MSTFHSRRHVNELKNIEHWLEQINLGNTEPFYLIYGEDHRLIKQYTNRLLQVLCPYEFRDMNFLSMDAKEFSVSHVIDFCSTMPFLASRRVLLLENCYLLLDSKKNLKKIQKQMDLFIDWLKMNTSGKETFTIIFVFYEDLEKVTVSKSSKIFKIISTSGELIECPLPEIIYKFINACSESNILNAIQCLQEIFDEGIDYSELGYRLMPRVRYPLKKMLLNAKSPKANQTQFKNCLNKYLLTLETEEKLRPRFLDLVSESPQYVIEQWIMNGQETVID